jgi:hypothetical protein
MELAEQIARAMIKHLRPAHRGDPRAVDIDEADVDFIELAEIAIAEIIKGAAPCGVCGCAVYRGLPTAG